MKFLNTCIIILLIGAVLCTPEIPEGENKITEKRGNYGFGYGGYGGYHGGYGYGHGHHGYGHGYGYPYGHHYHGPSYYGHGYGGFPHGFGGYHH